MAGALQFRNPGTLFSLHSVSFLRSTSRSLPSRASHLPAPLSVLRLSKSLHFADPRSGIHRSFLTLMAASINEKNLTTTALSDNTIPSKEVLEIWQNAEAVCFDVDSTVCVDEGIDELAEFCGAGPIVAEWTAKAMGGSVPFEIALAERLDLFKPSLAKVNDFLAKRPPRLSPGISELMKKLRKKNVHVYLVSGGFRQMINPIAVLLGIPPENVFANRLIFGSSGQFLGFDEKEYTSRSGGKAVAVESIKKEHGYKSLVMIGDGATDCEARREGGADLFICYGGVQLRQKVAAKADWLVFRFQDLIQALGKNK